MASAKDAAEVVPPRSETLAKYGLTLGHWQLLVQAQGGVCAICGKLPPSGKLNIDHHHHSGGHWKDMSPERRRQYVRGLLCWTCNKICVGRGVTIEKLRASAAYLERWAENRLAA
jgi:hypothetical protein